MKTIQMMYHHLNWANQRILKTLRNNKDENQEVLRLFSHILFAERVWITRLRGLDSSHLSIWSDIDMEDCPQLVKQNEESITEFLASLTNTDLDKVISYTNSKGIEFKNTVQEILTHVALHGQYHRGQINLRLRIGGKEPMDVDFISFVR